MNNFLGNISWPKKSDMGIKLYTDLGGKTFLWNDKAKSKLKLPGSEKKSQISTMFSSP